MNISIALPAMAPQPTGHPASLPSDPAGPEVTQAQTSADSQGAQSGTHSNTGEKQSAPPSAMQLKIMQILEQQAEEMGRSSDQ